MAATAAAFADTPHATAPQDEIVVTGRAKRAFRSFVQSFAKVGATGQIARWDGHVCPTVIGLQSDQADFIEQRILDIARSVHLRPWKSGCTTSFIVIFAHDSGAFAASLVDEYADVFRGDRPGTVKEFVKSSRAVRWIAAASECGGDGCELLNGRLPNSRLVKATKPTLQAMVVVIDARKIAGYSLGELADFIALVGLTNPRAVQAEPSRSILFMFDVPKPEGVRFRLTPYDKAFLAGVYSTRLDDSGESQKATIASHMRKEIDGNGSSSSDEGSRN